MRKELIDALRVNFSAHVLKHKMNVEVMLKNPTALPDHTDLMDSLEKEIAMIAEYMDKLEVLDKHFND
jgi:hypothetical protein